MLCLHAIGRETEAMWLRWCVGTFQVFGKHFFSANKSRNFQRIELISWFVHASRFVTTGLVPICVFVGLFFQFEALMWLVALNLIPQFFMLISAYIKLSLGGMKPLEKLKQCYIAIFVLDTFISWICSIGLFRYITKQKQGWTPTGKAIEGVVPWSRVVKERWAMLAFSLTTLAYAGYTLMANSTGVSAALVGVCGFWGLNTLLAILLFGRSRMQETAEEAVKTGKVQNYMEFY